MTDLAIGLSRTRANTQAKVELAQTDSLRNSVPVTSSIVQIIQRWQNPVVATVGGLTDASTNRPDRKPLYRSRTSAGWRWQVKSVADGAEWVTEWVSRTVVLVKNHVLSDTGVTRGSDSWPSNSV